MPGNVDALLTIVGFVVGAAPVVMLGLSLTEDYDRRRVLPITAVAAAISGIVVAWCLDYFFHFASRTGP
jgi:predicted MFS family arabinose efflux permease